MKGGEILAFIRYSVERAIHGWNLQSLFHIRAENAIAVILSRQLTFSAQVITSGQASESRIQATL